MNRNVLKQQQQMMARLAKIQEELEGVTVEALAGGGVVRVVCNGQQRIESIVIDPKVVDPEDIEMLQDVVLIGVNDALEKAKTMANEKLATITGGIKIPGM